MFDQDLLPTKPLFDQQFFFTGAGTCVNVA